MGELWCPFCDCEAVANLGGTLFRCQDRECGRYFEEEDLQEAPVRRSKDDHEPSRWE